MSHLPLVVWRGYVFKVQTTVCFLLTGSCGFAGAAVFGEEHDQQEGTFPIVLARSPSTPACLTLLSWELKASGSPAHSVE